MFVYYHKCYAYNIIGLPCLVMVEIIVISKIVRVYLDKFERPVNRFSMFRKAFLRTPKIPFEIFEEHISNIIT